MVYIEKFGSNEGEKLIKSYNENLNCIIIVTHPECGYCQQMKPALDNLYKYLEGIKNESFSVLDINGDIVDEAKEDIPDLNVVEGYPTVFISRKNQTPTIYTGDRSLKDMKKFITDNLLLEENTSPKLTKKIKKRKKKKKGKKATQKAGKKRTGKKLKKRK